MEQIDKTAISVEFISANEIIALLHLQVCLENDNYQKVSNRLFHL